VTANFGAEYGNGLSIFNATTKSGTNVWHGSLFEMVQNDFFNAHNWFAHDQPLAPVRWNNYGGTLGGPIKKDKAFFFFTFQKNPIRNHQRNGYTVPVPSMLKGDFSQIPAKVDSVGNPVGTASLPVFDPGSLVATVDPATGGTTYTRTQLPGNKMTADQVSSVAKAILAQVPAPNYLNGDVQRGQNPQACAATEGLLPNYCLINNYFSNTSYTETWTTYLGKVDYDITKQNRLDSSFMLTTDNSASHNNPLAPQAGTVNTDKEYTGQISDFWTLTPHLVNEFRAALDRRPTSYLTPDIGQAWMQKLGVQGDLSNAFPTLQINSSIGGFSGPGNVSGSSADIYNSQNTYVISDIATWVRGKHIFKIGGEFDLFSYVAAYNGSETFNFPGYSTENPALYTADPTNPATAGLGYADFLFGQVHAWGAPYGPSYQARTHSLQLFVQDDFKVRPNLTLNLGLRWQVEPAWGETQGRVSSFEPGVVNPATGTPGAYVFGRSVLADTLWDLFSPRFGFAYSPRSKWAIRGGYGIYRVQKGNNSAGAIYNVGYARNSVAAGASYDMIHSAFDWDGGVPGYKGTTAADRTLTYQNGGYAPWVLKHTPLGYLQQWQVSVQHELPGGFLLDVAYVANRGVHLNAPRNFNEVPLNQLYRYTGPGVDMHPYLPWPIYPSGVVTDPHDAVSMYNSLQVSVKKQMGQGLSLIANYTQAKARDDWNSNGNSASGNGTPVQNPLNLKAAYSISNTDVPYFINGGAVYQLPFGKGKQFLNHGRLLDEVAGGWQVSAIWNVHGGLDFTPVNTVANTSGELGSPQLPIRVGNPWKAGQVAANPGCTAPAAVRTLTNYFNGCAYVVPPYGHLGQDNLRNSLRGPAWRTADMSVAKNFALFSVREQPVTFQLRMDAQDAFNHPNFGQPYAGTGTNVSFTGVIQNAQTARNLQLSGKVTF
jgi:hypothetical protein